MWSKKELVDKQALPALALLLTTLMYEPAAPTDNPISADPLQTAP